MCIDTHTERGNEIKLYTFPIEAHSFVCLCFRLTKENATLTYLCIRPSQFKVESNMKSLARLFCWLYGSGMFCVLYNTSIYTHRERENSHAPCAIWKIIHEKHSQNESIIIFRFARLLNLFHYLVRRQRKMRSQWKKNIA